MKTGPTESRRTNQRNPLDESLKINDNASEAEADMLDSISGGFKIRTNDADINNGTGQDYVYMAFADVAPFKFATAQ